MRGRGKRSKNPTFFNLAKIFIEDRQDKTTLDFIIQFFKNIDIFGDIKLQN